MQNKTTTPLIPIERVRDAEVKRPAWTTWLLITWLIATAAIYYTNFTQTFYQSNKPSIQALIEKLF
jgi:hypothetical protein